MFFSADGPADPYCSELVALHRSMNAPVVAIEDLPVGPARAAVALSKGGGDALDVNVTVAVRSVRTGQVAFFTAGGELRELRSANIAMDAALSFAESMGFLFDDEEVGIGGVEGSRVAAETWQRFSRGDADPPAASDDLKFAGPDLEAVQTEDLETLAAEDSLPSSQDRGGAWRPGEASGVVDELGPMLSPVAPLKGEAFRDFQPESPPRSEIPLETDDEPFRLRVANADVPRQFARAPISAGDSGTNVREQDFITPGKGTPENRDLLLDVLAETAVDRVCAAQRPAGPGLSKFRLKPSHPRSQDDPLPESPQREEHVPTAAQAREIPASRDETNRVARYHESPRRPHLLLRLLSRF